MKNEKENWNVISKYTSEQAKEDGILCDITNLNPKWKDGLFNYVTWNLISKCGLLSNKRLYSWNLTDLLNQAIGIVKRKSNNFKNFDNFFCGTIELADGSKKRIYMCLNETGKFTIMLPEDY